MTAQRDLGHSGGAYELMTAQQDSGHSGGAYELGQCVR